MVFKKPYAFLIKNFKIIHAILVVCSVYLIMRVNSILNFFEQFIKGGINKVYAIDYISNFYILVIILSIVICLIILVLMKYKKKPHFLYVVLIAVYLAIGFIIGYANSGLNVIYDSILGMKDLLLYRDILRILLVFQYISVVFVLVRALGFDIKKFDFDSELHSIKIEDVDDEEVELTFDDANKIDRKFRRKLRELKYYYFENRLYINVILVVLLFVIMSGIVIDKEVVNKFFFENETFSTENFTFSVSNSYISNIGDDNKKITNTDTSFVIVKLNVRNNNEPKELNVGRILLYVGDESYSSKTSYVKNFKDLGKAYNGNEIRGLNSYIFVFNVPNKSLKNNMYFIYGSDKKVRLKPVNLDEVSTKEVYQLGKEIDLSVTTLGSGIFNVKSYELGDKFNYNYTYMVMGQTFNGSLTISGVNKAILHLEIESSFSKDMDDFYLLSTYGVLHYEKAGESYISSFTNKSPSSYDDGVYLAVDKDLMNADKIWFDLVVRNRRYIYNIK